MTELVRHCTHDHSWTGAEGPAHKLDHHPILWNCDVCGALILHLQGASA